MQEMRAQLHRWYEENKRNLPWRHTKDAYKIWISEIMLQQTQVAQGLPYYLRFMSHFPDVQSLAKAPEEEVLKLWQGLGYYSRARNLHAAAKQVISDFDGHFPTQYDHLISLKGIGDYTASAVSSFSSGEARACVDGNVIRVLSRLFDIATPYDTGAGQKEIKALANSFLDSKDSATHNQAIMEFGALQCSPKSPNCEACIFNIECLAFANKKVESRPVKSKKTKVKRLYLYYFLVKQKDKFLIKQRTDSGIWKGMFEFPLIESEKKISKADILFRFEEERLNDCEAKISFANTYTHILSHRKIEARFIIVDCDSPFGAKPEEKWVDNETFSQFPISRLVERFWEDYTNHH